EPGDVGVVRASGQRVLELAHPAAERAARVGQLLGAEDDEGDDGDDDELEWSDSGNHVLLLVQVARKGLTAASTCVLVDARSNALGAGGLSRARRMSAAWRGASWAVAAGGAGEA